MIDTTACLKQVIATIRKEAPETKIGFDFDDFLYKEVGYDKLTMLTINLFLNAYSITSFLLYRGFEFIRNYIHHEKWPVVLAGGGRDKDYGYLGYSHWAEEDIEVLTNLRNINLYKPVDEQAMYQDVNTILEKKAPCYINLSK